jgi:hypothetical protein
MNGDDRLPLIPNEGRSMAAKAMIIYSVVARGKDVLSEVFQGKKPATGNYATVAAQLLKRFPTVDAKNTYNCNDDLNFHLLSSGGLFFLCLADKSVKLRIAYSFLGEVEKEFLSTYGDGWKSANAYSLNGFQKSMKSLMKKWNDPQVDQLSRVQSQVEEVKGVMQNNISKVLERGEKLEVLVDRTQNLAQSAQQFHKRSKKVACAMRWQSIKLSLMIGAIVVAVILVVYFSFKQPDSGGGSSTPTTPTTTSPPRP